MKSEKATAAAPQKTVLRIDQDDAQLLLTLQEKLGLSQAAAVRYAIRRATEFEAVIGDLLREVRPRAPLAITAFGKMAPPFQSRQSPLGGNQVTNTYPLECPDCGEPVPSASTACYGCKLPMLEIAQRWERAQ